MTKKSSISTALKAAVITLGFSFSSMAEVNVASITQYLPEGAAARLQWFNVYVACQYAKSFHSCRC